jgi:hypothetical protein
VAQNLYEVNTLVRQMSDTKAPRQQASWKSNAASQDLLYCRVVTTRHAEQAPGKGAASGNKGTVGAATATQVQQETAPQPQRNVAGGKQQQTLHTLGTMCSMQAEKMPELVAPTPLFTKT